MRSLVATAGSHQIWTIDPPGGTLSMLAGSGSESLVDAGVPRQSALAQTTGLVSLRGDALAFADCESSAVRVLEADSVRTLAGTGLFDFGDRAGVGGAALLPHCEDVAVHQGMLAVVDTYDDRLKRVDLTTWGCEAWSGEAGEPGALREPGGVWSDGWAMLVADTGNHRIVVAEPDGSLSEVRF